MEFGVDFDRDIFTFKYLQEYGRLVLTDNLHTKRVLSKKC